MGQLRRLHGPGALFTWRSVGLHVQQQSIWLDNNLLRPTGMQQQLPVGFLRFETREHLRIQGRYELALLCFWEVAVVLVDLSMGCGMLLMHWVRLLVW